MNTTLNRKLDFDKTRKDYRKVIWIYDFWNRITETKALEKVIELSVIKDRQNFLEIACGTGKLFEKIIIENPNGHNVGVDLSPDMLQKANFRLQKNGLKNFELHEADVLNLNLNYNSFDLLINNFMIDLLPESTFDNIANEFFKLLKPNGIAIISTFSFGTKGIHKFWFWIAKYVPALLTGCRPVTFKKHLEKAGFEIINYVQISQNTFPSEILKAKKPPLRDNVPG